MSFDWCCRCATSTTTTSTTPGPPFCCFPSRFHVDFGSGGWTNQHIGGTYNGNPCPDPISGCDDCVWPWLSPFCDPVYSCCSAVAGEFDFDVCGALQPAQCGLETGVPWAAPTANHCCGGYWVLPKTSLCSLQYCYCRDDIQYVQGTIAVDCDQETQQWRLALRVTTWLHTDWLPRPYCTAVYRSAWADYPPWLSNLVDEWGLVTLSKSSESCDSDMFATLCGGGLPATITLSAGSALPDPCTSTTSTTSTSTTSPP